jgi:nucleoside-triphosphatase
MPNNFLVTGRPGCGKTSVIERVADLLREKGLRAGGIYCPEIREGGVRLGFKIIDVMGGEERVLAHVNRAEGPRVGKYRVDVGAVDEFSGRAINRALLEADYVIIDEIAPMEIHSRGFRRAVLDALDSPKPLLAAVHQRTGTGFIGEVKSRPDVKLFEITRDNIEGLPSELAGFIVSSISSRERLEFTPCRRLI